LLAHLDQIGRRALDGAALAACTAPQVYIALADGTHTLKVQGIDPAGNSSAASYAFTTIDATGAGHRRGWQHHRGAVPVHDREKGRGVAVERSTARLVVQRDFTVG
jgi:hypothetical protein